MRPTKTKLILVLLILFCSMLLFAGCSKSTEPDISTGHEVTLEDLILERDGAKAHIEQLKIDYHEKEQELQDIHRQADELREYVNDLNEAIYGNEETLPVMHRICELSPESPMCNDWEMLMDLKDVAEKRGTEYTLLLGIMWAESRLGTAWKPSVECAKSNNWAGLKARKYDDGTVSEWFDKQDNKIEGCWLYNFTDTHEFFESLANTISLGYAKCNNDIFCIEKVYVGHESAAWTNNVWKFYSLKK